MKRTIQRNDRVRDRLKVGPIVLESLKSKVRMTVHHEGKKKSNIALSPAEGLRMADALEQVSYDAIDKGLK